MPVKQSIRLLASYYRKSARFAVFIILLASFAARVEPMKSAWNIIISSPRRGWSGPRDEGTQRLIMRSSGGTIGSLGDME
jgi:hypothetical protein